MIAVLDANVVVSGYISAGPPAEILRRWRASSFALVTSDAILAEYSRVLRYSHLRRLHRFDDAAIDEIVEVFRLATTVVEPTQRLAVVQDETDNRFIECAVEGNAHLIVSGDRHLLSVGEYQDIRVLAPASFIAYLDLVKPEQR